jgi:hypothetical protein
MSQCQTWAPRRYISNSWPSETSRALIKDPRSELETSSWAMSIAHSLFSLSDNLNLTRWGLVIICDAVPTVLACQSDLWLSLSDKSVLFFLSLSMCLGGVQQPLDSLWRDPPVWITNLALKVRAPIVLRCSPLSMLQPRDSFHRS